VVNGTAPVWQLGQGWYNPEGDHRWIAPEAIARLLRPRGASRFQVRVKIYQGVLNAVGPLTLRLSIGEAELEPRRFSTEGWHQETWELPAADRETPDAPVRIRFQSSPPYQPPGETGLRSIAVGAFGFLDGRSTEPPK
jgi:hypothetical protein